jgi:DNA-binding transcriptional ArsR family regulator
LAVPGGDGGDVWAALADPTRRRLLDELSERGPLSATELAPHYPLTRQAVVKHLAALSNAGLLDSERHGRDVRYRVVPDRLDSAADWLGLVGARWDARLDALRARLEADNATHPPLALDTPGARNEPTGGSDKAAI